MTKFTENGVFIFLGPSLSKSEAQKLLPNAYFLPPVKCGDILQVLRLKPKLIAIIDGYFENTASIWHKEIMLAINQGITVCGASSMGALRAAELEQYGMIGIGNIFQQYQDGSLNDDDEVTLVHKSKEQDFKPVTDAMVNIRATLTKAISDNILTKANAELIKTCAKKLFYQHRTFTKACKNAVKEGLEHKISARFLTWLQQENSYVDQKRLDAIELLEKIATNNLPAINKLNSFNHTTVLSALQRTISCLPFSSHHDWLPIQEKIALKAEDYEEEFQLVKRLARMLALVYDLSLQQQYNIDNNTQTFGFINYDAKWQQQNDCHGKTFEVFMQHMQHIATITSFTREQPSKEIQTYMLTFLYANGEYLKYKQAGNVLKTLQLKNQFKYNTLLYTAYLWQVIENAAISKDLIPDDAALNHQITEFRQEHDLLTPEITSKWLTKHDISLDDFIDFGRRAIWFDYLIKNNNLHIFGSFPKDTDHWWLLDALYISDLYTKIKTS